MFCPAGTADPEGCPAGSYSNVRGLNNSLQCERCPDGMYCGEKNLTSPSGKAIFSFYKYYVLIDTSRILFQVEARNAELQ